MFDHNLEHICSCNATLRQPLEVTGERDLRRRARLRGVHGRDGPRSGRLPAHATTAMRCTRACCSDGVVRSHGGEMAGVSSDGDPGGRDVRRQLADRHGRDVEVGQPRPCSGNQDTRQGDIGK